MRKWLVCLLCIIIDAVSASALAGVSLSSQDLRLDNSGNTPCTMLLQKGIDQISKKGGGTLVLKAGRYLTGGLMLHSGVTLEFEEGAVLLGSTNPYDYQIMTVEDTDDQRGDNAAMALIMANGAEHIAITGKGIINGQGLQLALNIDSLHHTGERPDAHYNQRRQRPSELARPKLFFFYRCKDVTISGMALKSSANWGLSFDGCEQISLTDLDIENRAYWNNDGIDLTDCRHVKVSRCSINSADDGICLKSYHVKMPACTVCGDMTTCHDVEVNRCDIRSSASAIKFGTASWGDFHRVHISDIKVRDTFRSAIAIESVDGAQIDSIVVERVEATNTGNPIFLRLGQRAGQRKGSLRNVTIRDFTCEVPFGRPDEAYDLRGPEVDFFHNPFPSSICGIPGNRIEHITLENIKILYPGRATKGMACIPLWRVNDVPEQIQKYPEFSMFGELPAWGFFVRHVDGIHFRNILLSLADKDFRPAFVFSDALQVTLDAVQPSDSTQVFHFIHDN